VNVLIDDHLLREVLLEREPGWLRRVRRGGQISTTGSWYYRLCGALQEPDIAGALSGPIAELPAELRSGVVERVMRLPDQIRLLSMRELAWSASGLGRRYGLNLMAAEALGAAIAKHAAIATLGPNLPPRLAAAADAEGIRVVTR
jgi:hypothetical protein